MKIGNEDRIFLNDLHYPVQLLYRYPEFAFIVTSGDLDISACHDIRAKPYTYRVAMTIFLTEFLEVGQTIDIHIHAKCYRFLNFVKGNTVGGIQYLAGCK